MKINDIIRTRRQALGLTQEGLAAKLGVSAPAVNKWEKALNYPDITLLPTLARTLGVDLNTLLSFQEDMSREEIGMFLNELTETAKSSGCIAAFQLAKNKLWEFPNHDLLACNIAGVLEGILVLYPESDEEECKCQKQEIAALYERAAHSVDPQIREYAAHMMAVRCIGNGELERAEGLLEQLPDTHSDKKILIASLREKQDRCEEAWGLLETELFVRANAIQTVLLRMIDLALAEGREDLAQIYADSASAIGKNLDLPDCTLSAPLQLALAQKDGPRALALLGKLLDSLAAPCNLSNSPFYRHLPTKDPTDETRGPLLQTLLDQLETDPESQFLREVPDYREMVGKYR